MGQRIGKKTKHMYTKIQKGVGRSKSLVNSHLHVQNHLFYYTQCTHYLLYSWFLSNKYTFNLRYTHRRIKRVYR